MTRLTLSSGDQNEVLSWAEQALLVLEGRCLSVVQKSHLQEEKDTSNPSLWVTNHILGGVEWRRWPIHGITQEQTGNINKEQEVRLVCCLGKYNFGLLLSYMCGNYVFKSCLEMGTHLSETSYLICHHFYRTVFKNAHYLTKLCSLREL